MDKPAAERSENKKEYYRRKMRESMLGYPKQVISSPPEANENKKEDNQCSGTLFHGILAASEEDWPVPCRIVGISGGHGKRKGSSKESGQGARIVFAFPASAVDLKE